MAEYQGRSNVNSVKRSRPMGRPKEQAAGWINDEGKKVTIGEWVKKMKKKK